MTKNSILSTIYATVLILMLSSCGFSLRGSDVLSVKFTSLQLSSQQANSELTRLLRRSLNTAGVAVSPIASEAFASDLPLLSIGNELVVARPVTVNPRARAAQIELRLSVDMALTLAERTLIPAETLFIERTYFEDIENINGNQEEIEIISREMRRELINQLMRRLSAAEISEPL